jgi:hypothetical protein
MGEAGRVLLDAIVGAGPRREVQLARLAWNASLREVRHQPGDGVRRERLPEELGLEVSVHLKRRRAVRFLVDLIGAAEVRPVRPRLCKGHLAAKVRLRIYPGPRDEVVEQLSRVSFASEQRPEQVDGRRLLHLAGNPQQQACARASSARSALNLPQDLLHLRKRVKDHERLVARPDAEHRPFGSDPGFLGNPLDQPGSRPASGRK